VFSQRTRNIQRNDVIIGQRTEQQTKHNSGNSIITDLIDKVINFSLQIIGWVVTSGSMDVAPDTFSHVNSFSHPLSATNHWLTNTTTASPMFSFPFLL
jgi:hypothetical protein